MELAIIIILAVVCAALALRVYTGERNLRTLARQLRKREEEDSNVRLGLAAPNSAAEELVAVVSELREARRLDAARFRAGDLALRRQIANVSHDLRTPLTSILGYLQLLEKEDLSPQERQEYLGVIEGRAKALQGLISAFYDLSRLDGGDYPIALQPVDLRAMLEQGLAQHYNELDERFSNIEVELAAGLPPVQADPEGVARIIANLLGNAVSHGEGELSVTLERQGDCLVTAFANGAPTMSEEDIPHVFDRSFTADKTRSGGSTGLGLAIVKALAGQMGHRVAAQWKDGIFTIRVFWKLTG